MSNAPSSTSRRAFIAAHVIERIASGEWKPGRRIPSENALTEQFGVSRMTVHHALRELTARGFLIRRSGSGTYVAEPGAYVAEYRHLDVIAEIEAAGGRHVAEVLRRDLRAASGEEAQAFAVDEASVLFHAVILHLSDGLPFELEDRLINPRFLPDAMAIDLSQQTLFSRLMLVRPSREGSEAVSAVAATSNEGRLLRIDAGTPCLEVVRRTWSTEGVVTVARMIRPGDSARMVGSIHSSNRQSNEAET